MQRKLLLPGWAPKVGRRAVGSLCETTPKNHNTRSSGPSPVEVALPGHVVPCATGTDARTRVPVTHIAMFYLLLLVAGLMLYCSVQRRAALPASPVSKPAAPWQPRFGARGAPRQGRNVMRCPQRAQAPTLR